nr:phosphatidylinositol synthase, isoform B [Drosophila melanogaster]AAN09359.1 phosphatidylinositol synthase, isoform B [Drosophila melanogaster]|eukprot:NP_727878.1 phosphatidylinositol synthase, isoform B [Drosophila melanogaster]
MTIAEHDNVFIFVPNLIGYARIVLALIAFWFMSTNYVISGWCYVTSALLDAVDGQAARAFNQTHCKHLSPPYWLSADIVEL